MMIFTRTTASVAGIGSIAGIDLIASTAGIVLVVMDIAHSQPEELVGVVVSTTTPSTPTTTTVVGLILGVVVDLAVASPVPDLVVVTTVLHLGVTTSLTIL